MRGDLNLDGERDVKDAVMLARLIGQDTDLNISDQGLANAECDGVEGITPDDLVMLLRVIADLIEMPD